MLAIMLLAFWHHHKPVPIDPLDSPVEGFRCIMQYEGIYEFDGPDGATGYSTLSCAFAYQNWKHIAPPPKRYEI